MGRPRSKIDTDFRSTKFLLLFYPDDPSHKAAMEYIGSTHWDYAFCKHDRDVSAETGEPVKPHVHFVLRFDNARWSSALASELGVESRWLEGCSSWGSACDYLTHSRHPDKFQYGPDDLCGTIRDEILKRMKVANEGKDLSAWLDILAQHSGPLTVAEYLKLAADNDLYSVVRRMGALGWQLLKEHNGYGFIPSK